MNPVQNKVALITGAAGGIGSATGRLFLQNQWDVIAVDKIQCHQAATINVLADLSRFEDIGRLCDGICVRYSQIHAIVNNAAEQLIKPLVETTPAEWDRVMASNVRASYLIAARFEPLLEAANGAIVNVASIHALVTSPGMAAYVASKGALTALTRAMALEFAGRGIRVNAVLPGAINTPMLSAGLERSRMDLQTLAGRHPLGRVGRPEDVAEAIYFLADATRSSFITGQSLVVDGGASARLSTE